MTTNKSRGKYRIKFAVSKRKKYIMKGNSNFHPEIIFVSVFTIYLRRFKIKLTNFINLLGFVSEVDAVIT